MMVLCLDFGNSQLKYARVEDEKIINSGTIEKADIESIASICESREIDAIILSSVIDIQSELIHFLKGIAPFHQLNSFSLTKVDYSQYDKSTLGVDRIALAEGAHQLYPDKSHFIICSGTCITYNWVENGYFKSGAISPGLMMRAKSMHDYTANLPLITPQMDFPTLGHTTSSNLLAGTMNGMLLEIEGYIRTLRKQDPRIITLICGGDAPYFIPRLGDLDVHFEKDLIWKGLAALARLNLGL